MASATVVDLAPISAAGLARKVDANCARMEQIQREAGKLQEELHALARETAGLNARLVERVLRDAS